MILVGELPLSKSNWEIALVRLKGGKEVVIAVNPEHPPYIIEDGEVKELKVEHE